MFKQTLGLVAFSLVLIILATLSCIPQAHSKKAPKVQGQAIFAQQCAQCHANGGNIVKSSKPVTGSAKLATLATFRQYLRAPAGHMPYFKNLDVDQQSIKALYDYCKQLKAPIQQAFSRQRSAF